jgi:hypothetical protein
MLNYSNLNTGCLNRTVSINYIKQSSRKIVVLVAMGKVGNTEFDPDAVYNQSPEEFMTPKAIKWANKLDPFNGKFVEVPSEESDERGHVNARDINAGVIYEYIASQLAKNGFTTDQCLLLVTPSMTKVTNGMPFERALAVLKQALANGKYEGFMDAAGRQAQFGREVDQQAEGLSITTQEFEMILNNLAQIGKVRSGWGVTVSTKKYILETTVKQKQQDEAMMNNWFRKMSTPLVKIVNLTVTDLPISYDVVAMAEFLANPSKASLKKNMKSVLLRFKNELVVLWREQGASFNIEGILENL